MDYEIARQNMIEQQIRPWEVLDQHILDLLAEIHREDFVPSAYKRLALADISIPLGNEQVTMTPKMEARIIQSLDITDRDKILEIGTGCGYMTALLGRLGREVFTVDIFPEFSEQANNKLTHKHFRNIKIYTGNALLGWPEAGPYDVIVVTGSAPSFIPEYRQQLNHGGRLFAIVGHSPVMDATLFTSIGNSELTREVLFETDLPPLVGCETTDTFQF